MTTEYPSLDVARQLIKEGDFPGAENFCLQILRSMPHEPEPLLVLGNLYLRQQRLSDAAAMLGRFLEFQPAHAVAHNSLGVVLAQQQQLDAAIAHFERALTLRPTYIDPAINRGRALREQGHLSAAIFQLQAVLRLNPNVALAHLELAHAFTCLDQLENVIHHYEQAIRLVPDHAEAHWNLAMAKLALGDYEQGWREYEWRWKCAAFAEFAPRAPQPEWDGSPLAGRTVLLTAEQGLGDTLQFIRYGSQVQAAGGTVVFQCPRRLEPILRSYQGVDQLLPDDVAMPPTDVRASLLSLPFLLRTSVETIPAQVPYLFADPLLIDHWRHEFDPSAFNIGITWQGSSRNRQDHDRSIPLSHFGRLANLPGVRLYSLQKGPGIEQLAAFAARHPIVDLGGRLDEASGAFMDTAAVMQHLDLVVACDTATAHLAGALGVRVWLALSTRAEWRWMRGSDTTPWYPTMRLFRQLEPGDWEFVFRRMATELEDSQEQCLTHCRDRADRRRQPRSGGSQ